MSQANGRLVFAVLRIYLGSQVITEQRSTSSIVFSNTLTWTEKIEFPDLLIAGKNNNSI